MITTRLTTAMFWIWFLAFHCKFTYGVLIHLQNAALHKPATQSSVYTDASGHMHIANQAVDGNNDTNFQNRSCSCTETTEAVLWWQVDLGDLFDIVQVTVTSRNAHAYRLHDFDVLVSNTTTASTSELCTHYSGEMTNGVTETLMCNTTTRGRYLRISKVMTIPDDHLTLCEVEVMVLDRKNRKFFQNRELMVVSSKPLLSVTHRVQCGKICLLDSTCVGFNYQEGSNLCQLLGSTENPVADANWWMYSLF